MKRPHAVCTTHTWKWTGEGNGAMYRQMCMECFAYRWEEKGKRVPFPDPKHEAKYQAWATEITVIGKTSSSRAKTALLEQKIREQEAEIEQKNIKIARFENDLSALKVMLDTMD